MWKKGEDEVVLVHIVKVYRRSGGVAFCIFLPWLTLRPGHFTSGTHGIGG
jgi:hypothetical protein